MTYDKYDLRRGKKVSCKILSRRNLCRELCRLPRYFRHGERYLNFLQKYRVQTHTKHPCHFQQTCTEIVSAPPVGGGVISGYEEGSCFQTQPTACAVSTSDI